MASEPPEQGAPQPGSERETGSTEEAASLEQLREVTRALASRLPPASLPSGPISPDAVPELAADLAAQLLSQMSELASGVPEPEVQGFMMATQCTGASYSCSKLTYTCSNSLHSCTGTFLCPNTYTCSGRFTGLTLFRAL